VIFNLSTPSLGITGSQDAASEGFDVDEATFNSLSRDHAASRPDTCNPLPGAFNSLSRDHFCAYWWMT
jgi:hypothetical protein